MVGVTNIRRTIKEGEGILPIPAECLGVPIPQLPCEPYSSLIYRFVVDRRATDGVGMKGEE